MREVGEVGGLLSSVVVDAEPEEDDEDEDGGGAGGGHQSGRALGFRDASSPWVGGGGGWRV